MKNNRLKSNFKFFAFLIILCLCAFCGVFFVKENRESLNSLVEVISNNDIDDNYNGVYVNSDNLNGSKKIYSGCFISRIDNYILIMNDKFYTFRSSCIGTYPLESGETKKLKISANKEKDTYVISYKDKEYIKNYGVNTIEPNHKISNSLKEIDLSSFELIMKESQFEEYYYNFESVIHSVFPEMKIKVTHIENEKFDLSLRYDGKEVYSYQIEDFSSLPKMYPFGKNVVVIEPNKNDDKYNYKFKVVDNTGIIYNFDNMLPIIIDDVTLNVDNSIFISFDERKRDFKVLIGFDKKMCESNSTSDDISYYEFSIVYNHRTNNFDRPQFVKTGYKNEGCDYVKTILGG